MRSQKAPQCVARMVSSRQCQVCLLFLGTFLTGSALYVYQPILSPYAQSLGASLSLIGLIGGAYGFAQLLTRIPIGLLSDRLGRRQPFIRAGAVLAGLGCLGFMLTAEPVLFIAWRVLAGLGGATLVVHAALFSAHFAPNESTRAMGLFIFSVGLAQTTSQLVGGWATESLGGKASFPLGVVAAVAGVAVLGFVHELGRPAAKALQGSGDLSALLGNQSVRLVLVLGFVGNFALVATVFTFVPVYAKALGSSPSELGILSGLATALFSIASLVSGAWVAPHLGERRVVGLGLGLLGLATIALPVARSFGPMAICQVGIGTGFGLCLPLLLNLCLEAAGTGGHATASGLFQSAAALGTFGGPAVGGLIAEWLGLVGMFVLVGGICMLAALVATAHLGARERL